MNAIDRTTFFDNFAELADAPNGVQKLRELILQLAVQGKLVPQDIADEPASKLLERIRAEKARLVKEKKIRKTEPLSPVTADEVPYELPGGWEWVRMSTIAICLQTGPFGSTLHKSDYVLNGIPVINPACIINQAIIPISTMAISETTKNRLASYCLQKDDVVIARRGEMGRCAIVTTKEEGWLCGTGCLILRLSTLIFHPFFSKLIGSDSIRKFLSDASVGTTMDNLNQRIFQSMLVALPPRDEQQRIVTKIDQLMALCDELATRQQKKQQKLQRLNNSVLDLLTSASEADDFTAAWQLVRDNFDILYTAPETIVKLRQSIIQLAVEGKLVAQDPAEEPVTVLLTKIRVQKEQMIKEKKIRKSDPLPPVTADEVPCVLPSGWGVQRFAELADIVGGVTKGRNLAGRVLASYPYLRVANVQRGYLNLAVMKEIEIPQEELAKYRVCTGDLLITEGGDWDKVGRTAIWDGQIENCIHQNHVFRARIFADQLSRSWVTQYLNSTVGRRYFESASKQTTNLASINMTQLRNCPIPIPPAAEQLRIITKVDRLMALCDALEARLLKAQTKVEILTTASVSALIA